VPYYRYHKQVTIWSNFQNLCLHGELAGLLVEIEVVYCAVERCQRLSLPLLPRRLLRLALLLLLGMLQRQQRLGFFRYVDLAVDVHAVRDRDALQLARRVLGDNLQEDARVHIVRLSGVPRP